MISLIIARSANDVIGLDNKLPWSNLSDDMQMFKVLTSGKTIVMGRKTFNSLPGILPNRKHIVITRTKIGSVDDRVVYLSDIDQIKPAKGEEIIIIGGSQIISLFASKIDRIYLTTLEKEISYNQNSDVVLFPTDLDLNLFEEKVGLFKQEDEKNFSAFKFQILDRRK
jgi:dihydrofolate reductase